MRSSASILLVLLLAVSAFAQDGAEPAEPLNKLCPVMEGSEVMPDIYVDFEGVRIWFCCDSCIEDFNNDPEAYASLVPQLVAARAARAAGQPAPAESGPVIASPVDDDGQGRGRGRGRGGDEDDDEDRSTSGVAAGPVEDEAVEHPFGVLHPAVVHFPIGLVTMAAVAAIFGLVFRGSFFRNSRTFCVVAGALTGVAAYFLGNEAEEAKGRMSDALHERVEAHEEWGLIALWVLVAVVVLELAYRAKPNVAALKWIAFLGVLAGAAVVGITGYLGGEIVQGKDHLGPLLRHLGLS